MTAGDLWELLREAELVRDIAWVLTNADERRGCEELFGHWIAGRKAAGRKAACNAGKRDGKWDVAP